MSDQKRDLVRCRSCSRLYFYALTASGAKMPLDPLPKAFEPPPPKPPNVVLENGIARVLRKDELTDESLAPRYLSHWASCPYSRREKEFVEKRRARGSARRQRLEAEEAELEQLRAGAPAEVRDR